MAGFELDKKALKKIADDAVKKGNCSVGRLDVRPLWASMAGR